MELPLELHITVLFLVSIAIAALIKVYFAKMKKVMRTDPDTMIRVLSWNAYLVPYFEVKKRPDVRTCQNQDWRASGLFIKISELKLAELGKIAQKKDISLIQEYWGSHCYSLEKHISATHTLLNKSWLGSPVFPVFVNELVDTVILNTIGKTGGLSVAIDDRFRILHNARQILDSKGGESLNRNIMAVLVDVGKKWPGKFLLACNTHLISHPTKQRSEPRAQQLIECRTFISNMLQLVRDRFHVPLKDCGVLFGGDFNIAAVSVQYQDMKNTFGSGMRDLFHEMYEESHLKEHYTYDAETNSMVLDHEDVGRIDYLLAFDEFVVGDKVEVLLRLDCAEMKVLKQEKGTEISDHWGLEADFRPPRS